MGLLSSIASIAAAGGRAVRVGVAWALEAAGFEETAKAVRLSATVPTPKGYLSPPASLTPQGRDPRETPRYPAGPAPVEPIYLAPGSWTMPDVDTALGQHEMGIFFQSGRLVDALLCDEYIASLINLSVGTVSGLPKGWSIEVAGLEEDFQLVLPTPEQDQILARVVLMGFCLAYDSRTDHMDMPQWRAWPAYACRYDVAREIWQVWDRARGMVDVQPGDGRWALFSLRSSRPWLAGYIRAVAPMMLIRQSTLFNWANHAQVYATPSRILEAPERMAEVKDVQDAYNSLKEIVGDSTYVLPHGVKLTLLELKEVTYEIYLKLRESIDACLAILFVGQLGTTKAAGGWGAAKTEQRVTQQIVERYVEILSPTVWRDILAPYDRWKRGTVNLLRVPKRLWDTVPPADKDAEAKRRALHAQAALSEAQELATYAKTPALFPRLVQICQERGYPRPVKPEPVAPPQPGQPGAAPQQEAA